MKILKYENIHILADENTPPQLLPLQYIENTNEALLAAYSIALNIAMEMLLTQDEKAIIHMFFYKQYSQKKIAQKLMISQSAVSKKKAVAIEKLQINLEYFAKAYKSINKTEN